jgi:hypothetical protein
MPSTRRIAALLAALAITSTTALTACSSSDDATTTQASTPASAEASLVGGTAVCDEASLRSAIEESYSAAGSDTKLLRVNDFQCSEGWAVVFPDVGTNEEDAVTVTEVLQAEGQFWLVKDRTDVCGTIDMAAPDQRPEDSQVPADIWVAACNTN